MVANEKLSQKAIHHRDHTSTMTHSFPSSNKPLVQRSSTLGRGASKRLRAPLAGLQLHDRNLLKEKRIDVERFPGSVAPGNHARLAL